MLHISIKAESLFTFLGLPITNSLLTSLIVLTLFLIIAISFQATTHSKNSRFAFFMRFVMGKLHGLFSSIFKDKVDRYFPLVAAFFLFILLSNWIGLMPGVGSVLLKEHSESIPLLRASTADLNTTIALALMAVVLIQFFGMRELGIGGYIKKFINLSNPINFFSGILEIVSEFSKILSFAFRLFGNIFAGEVLIAVVVFLVPVFVGFASLPFLLLEVFIGLIQALVFSMLVSVFISSAITPHH